MKRYRLNKVKFIRFILIIVLMIVVVWFGLSYGKILSKNLNEDVQLTDWNFFNVFTQLS